MAFAVHINMEHCTGCNNCVVACPVDALELHTVDPATKDKIYKVKGGKAIVLDFKAELCAGCGVCVTRARMMLSGWLDPGTQRQQKYSERME